MEKPSLLQKKYWKIHCAAALGFIVYATLLQVTKIYSPVWYLTGWPMPTTGVTRAWIQFLQGNVQEAFAYNRVFLCAPILALSIYRYILLKQNRDLYIGIVFALIFLINLFI